MKVSFFIPCIPPRATAQQKGAFALPSGGIRFFKKAHVAAAERDLVALLMPHRPEEAMRGPLLMALQIRFPFRKCESKRRVALGEIPCDTRPDLDNLAKMALDAMTRCGFWRDDAQVATLYVSKVWASEPGIYVSVAEVDGDGGAMNAGTPVAAVDAAVSTHRRPATSVERQGEA